MLLHLYAEKYDLNHMRLSRDRRSSAPGCRGALVRHLGPVVAVVLFLTAASASAEEALLLPIHGPIDQFQAVLVQRGVERAVREGYDHLILDIDTFGGRVDSALEIASALSAAEGVTTVAYVGNNPRGRGVSWSAGALISFACNLIYMAPGTSIGAATPVLQGPEGQETASEKTVSAVRGQMAALAERNGHPPAVARAMVDPAVSLTAVRVDGELRLLTASELEALEPRTAAGSGNSAGGSPSADGAGAAGSDVELTDREVVSEEGKLLTLTAGQMERYGISLGSPPNRDALAEALGASGYEVMEPSGTDRAVSVLTGSGFTTLLILAGLVALFIEITSPGFGLPGAVALTAFATLFVSNLLLGTVSSLEILLFVIGIGLLIFELFVIPGFGVAGISGLAAITISLILALQRFVIPEFDYQWEILGENALIVLGSVVGSILAALLLAMLVKNTRFFSRLALAESQDAAAGYTVQETAVRERYLGREGTAETTLRPSGKIRLGEEVLPAESEGSFIDKGAPIRVVRVDGNRLVVREV